MIDSLLIEGVSFTGVAGKLSFIGISLSKFSNPMSLKELMLSPRPPNRFV